MNEKQRQIVQTAIDEALDALPNGDDEQLTDWLMTHCYPSFPKDVRQAMAYEGLKEEIRDVIRDVARELGVTLREE